MGLRDTEQHFSKSKSRFCKHTDRLEKSSLLKLTVVQVGASLEALIGRSEAWSCTPPKVLRVISRSQDLPAKGCDNVLNDLTYLLLHAGKIIHVATEIIDPGLNSFIWHLLKRLTCLEIVSK